MDGNVRSIVPNYVEAINEGSMPHESNSGSNVGQACVTRKQQSSEVAGKAVSVAGNQSQETMHTKD